MKRILFLLFLATAVLCVEAQDRVSTYTARLRMPDPSTGAQATVSNDPEVAGGLLTSPRKDKVTGYRICIFFDNSQSARSQANGALGTFRTHFAALPGDVIYDTPTFRTMVGYFLDRTEATMLLGRVHEFFPDAFIRPVEVTPDNLRSTQVTPASATETETLEQTAQ